MIEQNIKRYLDACRIDSGYGYRVALGNAECLYGSCYAAMLVHYFGWHVAPTQKREWAAYIQHHQDRDSGLFVGPELSQDQLKSDAHSVEHLSMHLTAHVLPALSLLDAKPEHPLHFMEPYMTPAGLTSWLDARDWDLTWIEGNNLLFMGQFLTHLYRHENDQRVPELMVVFFDWLDRMQDPETGFWGTQSGCNLCDAMYGAYHQLLLYYCYDRPVQQCQRIIDNILAMQHFDGGYAPWQNAGTCAMVDGIDILVNLYKLNDYRRRAIRKSLRRAVKLVLSKLKPDGGFISIPGRKFSHMGMALTEAPIGASNLFSTWFYTHALFLAGEVLGREMDGILGSQRRFNTDCSMGWHRGDVGYNRVSHPFLERLHDGMDIGGRYAMKRTYNLLRPDRM